MEHFNIIIITSIICIASSVFFTPCDCLRLVSSPHHDLASDHGHQLTHPAVLPRKLKLNEEHSSVKKDYIETDQSKATYNAKKDAFIDDKARTKDAKSTSSSSITTWREWVEGGDTSQYFTMDYSRVRRRRPIHNKSLPVTP